MEDLALQKPFVKMFQNLKQEFFFLFKNMYGDVFKNMYMVFSVMLFIYGIKTDKMH